MTLGTFNLAAYWLDLHVTSIEHTNHACRYVIAHSFYANDDVDDGGGVVANDCNLILLRPEDRNQCFSLGTAVCLALQNYYESITGH